MRMTTSRRCFRALLVTSLSPAHDDNSVIFKSRAVIEAALPRAMQRLLACNNPPRLKPPLIPTWGAATITVNRPVAIIEIGLLNSHFHLHSPLWLSILLGVPGDVSETIHASPTDKKFDRPKPSSLRRVTNVAGTDGARFDQR